MVKLCEGPGQPFADGATVIVAVTGALVVLITLNDGISPVPPAARPIEVLSLAQLKPVPLTAPVKLIALVVAPLHKIWLAGCTTLGVGLTVMVKLCAAAVQLLAEGVTVIVAVTGALVVLIAIKDGILPVPLATRPIEVLSLAQLKFVPLTAPVKFIALVDEPLHKTWLAGSTTLGVGLTVMVKLCEGPGHPNAVGVTVIVAVTGTLVVLIAVKAGILPVPPAAKPIEVLLLAQLKTVLPTAPLKFIALVAAPLHKLWLPG